MNRSLRRLYLALAGGFGLLMLMLGWWQVVAANDLKDRSDNAQQIQAEKLIDRGTILSADGRRLAISRARRIKGQKVFERVYPQGGLMAQVVGYSLAEDGSKTGVEKEYDRYLAGSFGAQPLLQRLNLSEKEGANVQLTLDTRIQTVAEQALLGRAGAVVALDPRTGAVLTMASSPTFSLQDITEGKIKQAPDTSLLNRATQGRYPPGSTFKVVTTTSALVNSLYDENSSFDDTGSYDATGGGDPIRNFGSERYGRVTLRTALTNSINTVFASIGDDLGPDRLGATMSAYGFGTRPGIDLPEEMVLPSGRLDGNTVLANDARGEDTARIAIGQERVLATPLQMAMVAATVANDGVEMQPHVMSRIVDRGGSVIQTAEPREVSTVMTPEQAAELTSMMEDVVRSGTGTAAALSGLTVAGKTGTAETGIATQNQAWFIGFAPADDPVVAVAVVIEKSSATGGDVAAPVAGEVMRAAIEARG
ncbi:MAG: peptidoglycan D,D-transpeptidase FtsI family protein [Thermoleophilia bacterium]